MTQPLLAYTYRLDNPSRVDQTLHILPDGQVWYWATLPGVDRPAGSAGTFQFDLDDATLATCRKLAEELVITPAPDPAPVRHAMDMVDMTVTAHVDGVERTHPYGSGELPRVLRDAADVAPALMSRAESTPVSVVSLAIDVRPGPPDGNRYTLRFVLTCAGHHPVTFTLRPDSLRVDRLVGGAWRELWAYGGQPVLGLVGPYGNLVDGVIVPATLAPGESAALTFANATEGGDEPLLRATAEGRVALLRADGASVASPDRSMRLVSS